MANGVIAKVALTISSSTTNPSSTVQLTSSAGAAVDGSALAVSSTGNTVSIQQAPPPTWGISGIITGGSGATVTLSGAASATTTADGSGNYTFSGLSNGSYTVTPTKSGFTFNPGNKAVTLSGANSIGVNFTASAVTWSISGTIASGSGATVTLSG